MPKEVLVGQLIPRQRTHCRSPPDTVRSAANPNIVLMSASGVSARLVSAPVFKTGGGCEQRSQWVRFPYTPAPPACVERRKPFSFLLLRRRMTVRRSSCHPSGSDFWSDFPVGRSD